MNKFIAVCVSLLLCAGFCFAKMRASLAGPFQWGHSLAPLTTISMKTAENGYIYKTTNLITKKI